MSRSFEADGDRWIATVDPQAAHAGMSSIVFHCVTDTQRPYRVLEVPAEQAAERELALSERELRSHFGNAHIMDYSLDESAEPRYYSP